MFTRTPVTSYTVSRFFAFITYIYSLNPLNMQKVSSAGQSIQNAPQHPKLDSGTHHFIHFYSSNPSSEKSGSATGCGVSIYYTK